MLKPIQFLLLFSSALLVLCTACEEAPDSTPPTDGDIADGDRVDSDSPDGDSFDSELADGDEDRDAQETDGDEEPQPGDWRLPYSAPDGRGSFNVGAQAVVFEDTVNERHLSGMIWYPTEAESGDTIYYQGLIAAENVFKDAPLADQGPFPVIVFSHGNTGFAEQSFYLTEFFASHGFVVAACDHIGNTAGTFDPELIGWISQQRPQDISIMIDYLEAWQAESGHFLAGRLDLDHIAAIGHSFGGFTVLYLGGAQPHIEDAIAICDTATGDERPAFCGLIGSEQLATVDPDLVVADPRVKAIVAQAPAGYIYFGAEGLGEIGIPAQVQVGDKDLTLDYQKESVAIYDALAPVKELFIFKDAGHFSFSNMCSLISSFGDGCGEGFMEAERTWTLSNLFALAFIRSFVFGEPRDRMYLEQDYADTLPDITLSSEHE